MEKVVLFVLLGAAVIAILLFSNFGKKLESKTDAQLYHRYERWTDHAMKFELWDERKTKAYDEVKRMEQELERRGYDMNKLGREAIDAKLFERPINFSLCSKEA
jgi:hypothetical protein